MYCEDRGHTAELVFNLERLLRKLLTVDTTNGPELFFLVLGWACMESPTKNQKIRDLK